MRISDLDLRLISFLCKDKNVSAIDMQNWFYVVIS